jgi:hypothetical protein
MPTDTTKPVLFSGSMIDPNPPLTANLASEDLISKQWASIVIHCPAGIYNFYKLLENVQFSI